MAAPKSSEMLSVTNSFAHFTLAEKRINGRTSGTCSTHVNVVDACLLQLCSQCHEA